MAAFGSSPKEPYVIVIGGTGHGKSTFINALANFFLNGSLPGNIKVAIKTKFLRGNLGLKDTETGCDKPMVSQTNECTAYRFTHPLTNQVFNLIDTPGLSDTRGVETDDRNVDRVIKAAEICPHLSAMVLIVNGTQARFTIEMQNIFTRLRGILPDVILQNVIVVFTNTWEHERNFNVDSLRYLHDKEGCKLQGKDGKDIVLLPLRNDHIFHLNNTAFSSDPARWDAKTTRRLQTDWDDCNEEIQEVLKLIASMATRSSSVFTEMRASRDQIKSALAQAKLDIVKLQEIQDKIDQSKADLGRHANDAEQFKNYKQSTTVKSIEMVDVGYHSTMCSNCNHVCHDHCGLDEISTQGSNQFMQCYAMAGSSNCTICPGKCSYTVHFHDRKTMREVEKTLESELEDMKQKYLAAQQGSAQAQQDLDTHETAEKAIDDAITACTQKVEASCHNLKKLCSGFNFVDELAITIQQLEFEARSLRSLKARDSADKIIRMLKTLVDKLNLEDTKTGLSTPAGGWGASRSSPSSSARQAPAAAPAKSAPLSPRTPPPSTTQTQATPPARGVQAICQEAGCSQRGSAVSGKFCSECGKPPALPTSQPVCRTHGCLQHGKVVVGRFCSECGKPPALPTSQPVCRTSACPLNGKLVGKFCSECGNNPS